ncbi:MAG: hypothetical protein APR54_09415 [Candidatus Cloacimonas sp. SDB]|nr:MAG: hypothetical protein APR54_09415 [Candidatus Cloacimonas sp. SDB]
MFCPKCRAEYVEGITHCPDCNVKLVKELADDSLDDKIDLEIVFETPNPALIPIVKSILEDAGIYYKTKSEGLQTIYALGLVKFQVKKEEAQTARELLKDLKKE